MTTSRPFEGPADLRAMQDLVRRIWSPDCHLHIGDLAWQRRMHRGQDDDTVLWEADGVVVAWGWLQGDALELAVDPARPELADVVLERLPAREVTVLETERYLADALGRLGFTPGDHLLRYLARDLADLPEPVLPSGFTARSITEADVAERVAVHRRAWAPGSTMTEEAHRTVMASWPYEPGLDWVVEGPDGRFAANCLVWPDHHNGVGEFEPVGTDPEFRRLGLGRAVCLAALHALRAKGIGRAVVYCVGTNLPASALYESLGFEQYNRTVTHVR